MKKYLLLCVFFLLTFLFSSCGGGGGSFSSSAIEEKKEDFRIEKVTPSTSPLYFEWLKSWPEDIHDFPNFFNTQESPLWVYLEWSSETPYDFYEYYPCDYWFSLRGTGKENINCHIATTFLLQKYTGSYHKIDQPGILDHAVFQGTDSEGVFFISFSGTKCKFCRTFEEIYTEYKKFHEKSLNNDLPPRFTPGLMVRKLNGKMD